MKKCFMLSIFSLLILISEANAQLVRVSGRVTSQEDGTGLPGVSVVVKGTQRGTSTDANGAFTIEAEPNSTLSFSFIGFTSRDVPVNGRTAVDVVLSSDTRQLSEVVVIGYGTAQRTRVTSSISSIGGQAIANLATPSFDQQLAGRAAGVQVTIPSGIIGQAPIIRIRGTNSITSGTQPLIVVDGVPIITGNQSTVTSTNPLGDINPQDIESYEVLKDGAATAIYGSRAANGVILITTKKGRKGTGVKVNLDIQGGFTRPISRFDLLNAQEFVDISNEKFTNAGLQPQARLDSLRTNTDWQEQIFRTGVSQNYNLSVTGGGERTSYYYSLGYNNISGAIRPNGQNRYSFLTNIDHSVNRFLTVGAKVQVARTENTGLNTNSNGLSGNIANAARLFPNVPILNSRHPTGYNISPDGAVLGNGANLRNIDNNYTNIAFVLDNNIFQAASSRVLANGYLQVNFTDWLNFRTQLGSDITSLRDFLSWDPRHGDGRGSNGLVSRTSRELIRWNWQNLLNFDKDFGPHNFNVTLGVEYQKTNISSFTSGGQNFSDRFFQQNGLVTGTYATQTSSGLFTPTGFDSYFGRILYSFRDKYLLSFSARNDGISSLPLANRRGTFLGGSVGYRLSQEEFYRNSDVARVINDAKIRASYAEVGNVDIGAFPYAGLFSSAQYASQNGIGYGQAGNPDLRWEASKKIGVGLDLSFLNNRITGTFDYFRNNIDGIILAAPTAPSLGIPGNSISRNVGRMYNQGFEFGVTVNAINRENFKWNVNANFTTIKNRVLELNKNTEGIDQDITFTYTINRVGQPISALYGFESAGVNPGNGNPLLRKGDGRLVQRDVNTGTYSFYDPANPTNTSNTQGAGLSSVDVANGGDRRILGNSQPTYFGGLTNTFSWKGLDLEVFIRFSGGNKIMNVTRQETLLNQDFNNNGREILGRWRSDNTNTDVPRLYLNRGNIINFNGQTISRFVESGDFVRIQNIILGYTLPKSLFNPGAAFPISSIRLFAQVQNAFTFTKYTGLDPELNFNQSGDTNFNQFGVDYNSNPQIRFVNFGVNVGF